MKEKNRIKFIRYNFNDIFDIIIPVFGQICVQKYQNEQF